MFTTEFGGNASSCLSAKGVFVKLREGHGTKTEPLPLGPRAVLFEASFWVSEMATREARITSSM